ncbi:MAG: hydroxyacylglutathione hydrolase [Myxococcota bacterium]|jgi:hydroxyacylglutathione hydrolase
MLKVHTVPVTPFMQNCTVLECTETNQAVVCDCGDAQPILDFIARQKLDVVAVWATHGHLDHIGGTHDLVAQLKVPFFFPQQDDFLRTTLPEHARNYGFPAVAVPSVDHNIDDVKELSFGNVVIEVRNCPGHTPGHVVFYCAADNVVIAGDVMFNGSIGRTDFPRGSFAQLERSIQEQMYSLPPQTVVHCGHGPTTTIGHEAQTNPFVKLK